MLLQAWGVMSSSDPANSSTAKKMSRQSPWGDSEPPRGTTRCCAQGLLHSLELQERRRKNPLHSLGSQQPADVV